MAQSGFSGMIIVCAAVATLAFSSWQVVGFVVYGSGVQQCTVSNIFGPLVVWSETSQTFSSRNWSVLDSKIAQFEEDCHILCNPQCGSRERSNTQSFVIYHMHLVMDDLHK